MSRWGKINLNMESQKDPFLSRIPGLQRQSAITRSQFAADAPKASVAARLDSFAPPKQI
ncbi:hypothetical protein J6590_043762 [Homalodisca vitripennis]|nr:hypothetical protein J6590_043762 [Homalodisca vitripennis]